VYLRRTTNVLYDGIAVRLHCTLVLIPPYTPFFVTIVDRQTGVDSVISVPGTPDGCLVLAVLDRTGEQREWDLSYRGNRYSRVHLVVVVVVLVILVVGS
jgi:hypothetical protein